MAHEELILGIESSCDDTSIGIVDRHGRVLACETAGQEIIHNQHGGVYPEYASRAHAQSIYPAIDKALAAAGVRGQDLRAIAVTRGPGLIGSLQVGINAAASLALGWSIPVIGVNHLRGHLRSADLEEARVTYPAVVLLASGGHTILAHLPDRHDAIVLGRTRDDSVGEAYDKVARMLGLGFPGGKAIDQRAALGTANIRFPRPILQQGLDFSFSGLKSAVARHIESHPEIPVEDVCASFVEACLDILVTKAERAIEATRASCLVLVGGVAASAQLRAGMARMAEKNGVKLCLPPLKWSTDNGAMIALAGWEYLECGLAPELVATPRIPLSAF